MPARSGGRGAHVATFGYEVGTDGKIRPRVYDAGALGAGLLE